LQGVERRGFRRPAPKLDSVLSRDANAAREFLDGDDNFDKGDWRGCRDNFDLAFRLALARRRLNTSKAGEQQHDGNDNQEDNENYEKE